MTSFFDFKATTIDGQERDLSEYRGKTVVVVNVASKCGFTPHYAGLQEIFEAYENRDVVVLGFPCNQFGAQEPGTEAQIAEFCSTTYGVTFPMFAKIEVNGPDRHPLYAWLTTQPTEPDGPGDIAWNFVKFIVGPDGQVKGRYSARTAPSELAEPLERVLGA